MKKLAHQTIFEEYSSEAELSEHDRALLASARSARPGAHAPYSSYLVGAALRLVNGQVVVGSNQENMAYPSGLCAERVAFFAAGAQYPGVVIESVAIVAGSLNEPTNKPSASCGACRQSMLEYELNQGSAIRVIMQGLSGPVHVARSVSDLLPFHFNPDGLRKQT